jgi:integrase
MTRAELDLSASKWTIPGGRSKNGREHVVPLTAPALEVIGATLRASEGFEHLFPAPGGRRGPHLHRHSVEQAWRRVCAREEVGIVDATPHDVRRTVATRLADLGVQPHVVEALLNHVSGHRAGVAGVYNRASYETELRQALERWAQHLAGLIGALAGRVLDGAAAE